MINVREERLIADMAHAIDASVTRENAGDVFGLKSAVVVARAAFEALPETVKAAIRDDHAFRPLLILSSGEFSDYSWSGPYRPLRSFTMAEAVEAFKAQWKPMYKWQKGPDCDEFPGWLSANGWIEQIDSDEVHVGNYGGLELSSESLALRLES